MEFEGIIKFIGQEESVGSNNLRKLTFVVEENNDKEYKSIMSIELFNDKIELIRAHKVGDVVKVGINFRAREYNGKWFNSISAWRIDSNGNGGGAGNKSGSNNSSSNDDLPF